MRILIVDDEASIRKTTAIAVQTAGHEAVEASSGARALKLVETEGFDVCFLDVKLGAEDGLAVMDKMLLAARGLAVVMFTAFANIATAVEAMRRGAFDFIPKPFTPEQVRQVLQKIVRTRSLEQRVRQLESQLADESPEIDLASAEPAVQRVLDIAFRAADTTATVLIVGPSGTGKNVLAREIHRRSAQRDRPFVTVNCPSLSRELLESELFGHVHGAFTGAVQDTFGKVAAAEGGTLFLDEIGELPLEIQPKSLLIDVGTNGEIVLGGKDWMASCSCSAGPAFEGGEVVCGMRAMPGAIERISIDTLFNVTYSTIAGHKPIGVCGSGLIDLIACLFRAGIVDKKGRIQDVHTDRVRKTENGREFVIAWADETGQPNLKISPSMNGVMSKAPPKKDITITDDDLANIIRTKAAVYAACEILLKSVDMGFADLDRVYVAGGFGNYIDVDNAITIGLLPDMPKEKFSFIGNASLGGARLALMSQKKRDEALDVHRSMTYLELTTNASFFDRFTSASFLPHTDLSQFPSLGQPPKRSEL